MRIIAILLFSFLSVRSIAQDSTYSMIAIAKQLPYGLDTTRAHFISLKEEIYVQPKGGRSVKGKLENISSTGITVDGILFPYDTIETLGQYTDKKLFTGKILLGIGSGMIAGLGLTYLYFFERSKHTDHYSAADDGMFLTLGAAFVVVPVALVAITAGLVRICNHGFQKYPVNKKVSLLGYTKSKVTRIYN